MKILRNVPKPPVLDEAALAQIKREAEEWRRGFARLSAGMEVYPRYIGHFSLKKGL